MKSIWITALMLLLPAMAWSQKVEISRVFPQEVEGKAFTLTQDATVSVTGTAAVYADNWRSLIFYGWIINSDTREVVWHWLDEKDSRFRGRDRDDDRYRDGIQDIDVKVELKKGTYELYYTGANTGNGYEQSVSINGIGDLVDAVFDRRRERREKYRDRYRDDLSIAVSSPSLQPADLDKVIEGVTEHAILSINKVRDDEDFEKGFTLTKETSLDIYALGEGRRDDIFDYVWIYNTGTRERVFEMNYRDAEYAGGAEKNLSVRETIKLPAGSYMVSYITDDSHNYNDWNALPPDDPEFYGVTIWPTTVGEKANVTEYVKPKTATPLVDLTRIRDDEFVSKGITLSSAMEVRVLCLGEEGNSDGMVDFGWIMNADTREKVWEMDSWRTEHAGGADKNRMVDKKITLEAGNYIVYYTTDGSHAYRDWNATRPHEDDLWGISLWATNDSDISKVKAFDTESYKSENVIAEITMVGNDKYLRENFELTEDTKVTIMGLGEGSSGEMHDFGYVKNMDTGEIVYEMRYRHSDWAGGARKNREFNETLTLEKGNYRIVYETDGSHAYRRWNADAPRNPELWGITIMKN